MRRAIATVCMLAMVAPVAADPRKTVVLQSEGRADPALRAKIDAAVLKLARASDPAATAGDISYSDAAAGVGCKPEEKSCKDDVIGMLAVDEIIYTTVTPKPGGNEIAVHRVSKGGASREAQMILPAGQSPESLDGIAPLFGGTPGAGTAKTTGGSHATSDTTAPPSTDTTPLPATDTGPTSPTETAPTGGMPAQPISSVYEPDEHNGRRRLELVGMIGGGSFVLLGFLMWGKANSIDGEIKNAPDRTAMDLQHIKDLETRGDSYANWGNVFFLAGAAAAGVSGYYYFKDRKAQRARTAAVTPTVFDHGAGLVLTIGGSR